MGTLDIENAYKQDAANRLVDMLKVGLGSGLAYGGYRHIRDTLSDGERATERRRLATTPLRLPVAGLEPPPVEKLAGMLDTLGINNNTGLNRGWTGRLAGDNADWLGAVPWFLAGTPVALGGGYLGGKAIANKVLGSVKQRQQSEEIADAKHEYEKQLGLVTKQAAEEPSLDHAFEKYAILNEMLGGYLLAALMGGGAAGYAAYKTGKSGDDLTMLNRAMQAKRQLSMSGPRSVMLEPFNPDEDEAPATPVISGAGAKLGQ